MNSSEKISDVKVLFDEEVIAVGTGTSAVLDLSYLQPHGYFLMEVETTDSGGTGVVQLQWQTKVSDTFDVPLDKDGVAVDDLVTAHAIGTKQYFITPPMTPVARLLATVTGEETTVTARIRVQ